MRVFYHPDFPGDIRKFEADYKAISDGLAMRFRKEVEDVFDAIKARRKAPGISCKRSQRRIATWMPGTYRGRHELQLR